MKDKKIELTSTIFFVVLSNAIFYSIIKTQKGGLYFENTEKLIY